LPETDLHFLVVIAEGLLMVFALRRILLLSGAWLPPIPLAPPSSWPSLAVLIPARNEERILPRVLDALSHLDYPTDRISFILVSDGSSDRTPELFALWAQGRPNVKVLILEGVGKAVALGAALAEAPLSDIVVTFDADTLPRPDSLRRLVASFTDPRVAAAGGLCLPSNPRESIVSRYSALEYWVHHFVNLSGKDRWRMGPVPSANIAAYRRDALIQVGGFLPGVADDVSTTLRILAAGYKSRYIVDAVAETQVVTTLSQLTAQRRRWAANLHHAAPSARGIETMIVAAGYVDRVVFALCMLLAMVGAIPLFVVVVYAGVLLASVITAVGRAGYAMRIPEFLAVAALMAPVELWLSLPILGRGRVLTWRPPGRSPSQTP
jgi:cellulose synthase/poly-beta-1,6-N-acetylglucosamine synthase-like glycosyltransferase